MLLNVVRPHVKRNIKGVQVEFDCYLFVGCNLV